MEQNHDNPQEEAAVIKCSICGENELDCFENPHSQLCVSCREAFIRFPVSKWVILFVAFMLIAACFGCGQMPQQILYLKQYKEAKAAYQKKNYVTAAHGLLAVTEKYPSAKDAREMYWLALLRNYEIDDAADFYNDHLLYADFSDSRSALLEDAYDHLYAFYESQNVLDPDFSLSEEEFYKAAYEKYQQEKSNYTYAYFAGLYLQNDGQYAQAIQCYASSQTLAKDFLPNNSCIGDCYFMQGNSKTAAEYYSLALETNKEDTWAMNGLCATQLLQGDIKAGLETAQTAYALDASAYMASENLVIALHINGEEAQMQELITSIRETAGVGLDSRVYQYLDGAITLREFYGILMSEEEKKDVYTGDHHQYIDISGGHCTRAGASAFLQDSAHTCF